MVNVGWWVHRQDPTNRGLQWSYLSLHLPLPSCLFLEEINIRHRTWDTEQKSCNYFWQSSYRVLEIAPLWQVPMLQRMLQAQEEAFW